MTGMGAHPFRGAKPAVTMGYGRGQEATWSSSSPEQSPGHQEREDSAAALGSLPGSAQGGWPADGLPGPHWGLAHLPPGLTCHLAPLRTPGPHLLFFLVAAACLGLSWPGTLSDLPSPPSPQDKHAEEVRKNKELKEEASR